MFGTLLLALLLLVQEIPGVADVPAVRVRQARPDRDRVRAGEAFKVGIEVEIPAGYHLYPAATRFRKKPTVFVFDGGEPAGPVVEPAPKRHKDEFDEYDYHEGTVGFEVPVRLKPGPPPGSLEVTGRIEYEICSSERCVQGKTPFAFKVELLEGFVAQERPAVRAREERGFLGLILLGMVGGLLSLVMPCTYPIIPLTITYFVKQAAGSRAHGLALSGVYSLGIILSFTGIGLVMTMLLGAGGPTIFAANPWVNLAVGALFLWFAGSLFGLYEIRIPLGLGSKLVSGPRKGAGGAFILGLLFSVVTFTCTIPIAATILAMAAGQQRAAALVAMLSYSVTMALPFFLMGFFPAAIRDVPKGGGWLNTIKVTMGFVEVGLALYYFSKADQVVGINVLNRWVMLAVWVAVAAVAALYLLDFFRSRIGPIRIGSAAAFLAFGGFMATGFWGRSLGRMEILVPPPPIHGTTFPAALEEAGRLKKPLFVEFTGLT